MTKHELVDLRKRVLKMSQCEMSAVLGISRSYLSRLEAPGLPDCKPSRQLTKHLELLKLRQDIG